MARLCLVFAALLMVSAISLVTARFQSRQLFVVAERMDAKARELDIDWRRLQLERAEQARNARIDELARDELKMVPVSPDRTIYIKGGALKGGEQSVAAAGDSNGGRP